MVKKIVFTNTIIIIFISNYLNAQMNDSSSHVDYGRLAFVGGLTAGAFVAGHLLQEDIWWKGEKSSFHFEWENDWKYALGTDKFGHFYFSYVVTNIYSDIFQWTGIKKDNSLLYAASLALTYQTYVEIRDGFSKQWGFSWGDFTANVLGAAYPLLQNKFNFLENFNFKISYYPSERFKSGSHNTIIDDYESTYDWLSINVYNLLPKAIKEFYPAFINIAVGHGVKNLDVPGKAYHEIYLALDWNLEALPGEGSFWKKVKEYLNFYRFPAPAVRIVPGTVWYGLRF